MFHKICSVVLLKKWRLTIHIEQEDFTINALRLQRLHDAPGPQCNTSAAICAKSCFLTAQDKRFEHDPVTRRLWPVRPPTAGGLRASRQCCSWLFLSAELRSVYGARPRYLQTTLSTSNSVATRTGMRCFYRSSSADGWKRWNSSVWSGQWKAA